MLNIMNTNQTQRPVFKHGCLLFINIVMYLKESVVDSMDIEKGKTIQSAES